MRIIFAGTPEFAASHLQALLNSDEHQLVAVYTQPDRRAGRGKKLLASPVKQLAVEHDIPVEQPLSLKGEEEQAALRNYAADIMVVVAYGLLLPQAVLDAPRYGCINVHASLLPRWRGAAPVERAIMAGDSETGITIMQMDAGLDTGDMLLVERCDIDEDETGDTLRQKLIKLGAPLLIQALDQIDRQQVQPQAQNDNLATYAKKLDKRESQIDWSVAAIDISRKVRALTSALSCFALLGGERVKVINCRADGDNGIVDQPGSIEVIDDKSFTGGTALRVQCGQSAVFIDQIQLAGGKAMNIAALHNGKPGYFKTGMCFDTATNSQV